MALVRRVTAMIAGDGSLSPDDAAFYARNKTQIDKLGELQFRIRVLYDKMFRTLPSGAVVELYLTEAETREMNELSAAIYAQWGVLEMVG